MCLLWLGRWLKPCPHCRRKVRLSQKTATVAEFGDSRRFLQQSHFSATVWTRLKCASAVTGAAPGGQCPLPSGCILLTMWCISGLLTGVTALTCLSGSSSNPVSYLASLTILLGVCIMCLINALAYCQSVAGAALAAPLHGRLTCRRSVALNTQ